LARIAIGNQLGHRKGLSNQPFRTEIERLSAIRLAHQKISIDHSPNRLLFTLFNAASRGRWRRLFGKVRFGLSVA
jgi:hypothetical protein